MVLLVVLFTLGAASVSALCSPSAPPSSNCPTAPQLWYEEGEIMALIHFNMATFVRDGDPGCTPENWNVKVGTL